LSSISLGLSTWPIPQGTEGVHAPSGTVGTCTAQGFFIQANIASPLYNFCLSLYYLFLVKYAIPEEKIRHHYEPWMHGCTIVFSVGTAIVCLSLEMFNDSSLWCWINALPKGCNQAYQHNDEAADCERGDNAEIFRWAFFFAPLWAAILGTMISMFLLWSSVRKQEDKAAKWTSKYMTASQFAGGVPHAENDARSSSSRFQSIKSSIERIFSLLSPNGRSNSRSGTNTNNQQSQSAEQSLPDHELRQLQAKQRESAKLHRKSNMVKDQAFRYVAIFWITWLPASLNRLLQVAGYNVFWVFVLHAIFVPLQGAMNWAVYKYPAFYQWRRARQKEKEALQRLQKRAILKEKRREEGLPDDYDASSDFHSSHHRTARVTSTDHRFSGLDSSHRHSHDRASSEDFDDIHSFDDDNDIHFEDTPVAVQQKTNAMEPIEGADPIEAVAESEPFPTKPIEDSNGENEAALVEQTDYSIPE